jgi:DNA-binding transcriptional regulator LsrR (DeoR family)
MISSIKDYENERLISRVLTLYYKKDRNQAEISKELGISVPKVNRLLKQARNLGWVEFNIHTPFQHIFELEQLLENRAGVKNAIVVPRLVDSPEVSLSAIGKVAADHLLELINDDAVICNGGGRGVASLVQAIETRRKHKVTVVPALGGVQGRFNTDVNSLAVTLAEKLGGVSYQLYAPAFCDTEGEREVLVNMRQVKGVLEMARNAQIAVVGLGTLHPVNSSFLQFTSLSPQDLQEIIDTESGVGEILARVIDKEGNSCALSYAKRVVGIDLDELRSIPLSIGIAALDNKAPAVAAALKGGYLKTIIMDDVTAIEALTYFKD